MSDGLISTARKNCNMCYARRGLRSTDKERVAARKALKELYYFYIDQFNELRSTSTPDNLVIKARENKTFCLNLLDECSSCKRDIDKINQGLREISK